uniref:Uncharacterized protein n=1 Tax=Trichogramma kaykai TaxID=54128 RepID=A0ABD2VW67_9HYME
MSSRAIVRYISALSPKRRAALNLPNLMIQSMLPTFGSNSRQPSGDNDAYRCIQPKGYVCTMKNCLARLSTPFKLYIIIYNTEVH